MKHTNLTIALLLVACALFVRGCQQSEARSIWKMQAERAASQVDSLTDQLVATQTNNDSLRAVIATTDSAYTADSIGWHIERRTWEQQTLSITSTYDGLSARLRALGDESVAILADSLSAAHDATVEAYEARINTYEQEATALRVRVGDLQSLVGGLELELDTQQRISASQAAQIEAWEKIANPPWHKKIGRAIPSLGAGATLAVLGLVAAGAL